MKVLTDLPATDQSAPATHTFDLPQGLIGFPGYNRAELLYLPDHLPFLWLRLHGPKDAVHFIVIEPGSVIPGYAPELFDEDAAGIGLTDPAEAMVLNIVTMARQRPLEATVNLVGPIIVNRRTRQARQLVIANYSKHSAHHPLVETAEPALQAAS
jgi:flagellar assembly factor FliW